MLNSSSVCSSFVILNPKEKIQNACKKAKLHFFDFVRSSFNFTVTFLSSFSEGLNCSDFCENFVFEIGTEKHFLAS